MFISTCLPYYKPATEQIEHGCMQKVDSVLGYIEKENIRVDAFLTVKISQYHKFLQKIDELFDVVKDTEFSIDFFRNTVHDLYKQFKNIRLFDENDITPQIVVDFSTEVIEFLLYDTLYDYEFEYTTTAPTVTAGRKKRQISDNDIKIIKRVVDQTDYKTSTNDMLQDVYNYIVGRSDKELTLFIDYFNRKHSLTVPFSIEGTKTEKKCTVQEIFNSLYAQRQTYLKNSRLERKGNRNTRITINAVDSICSETSPVTVPTIEPYNTPTQLTVTTNSPSRPTPSFLPTLSPQPPSILSNILSKSVKFVARKTGFNYKDPIDDYRSSPTLRPFDNNHVATYTYMPQTRTRRQDDEETKINLKLISDLTNPAHIAKSLANSYKLVSSHFVAVRLEKLARLLDNIIGAVMDLSELKNPSPTITKYNIVVVNKNTDTVYDLNSLTEGKLNVYHNKSEFIVYEPIEMCLNQKCAKLKASRTYVLANSNLKCEIAPLNIRDFTYCPALTVEYCMYAKQADQYCDFVGYTHQSTQDYVLKQNWIVFKDRRLGKKKFYLSDLELQNLLDTLFPTDYRFSLFFDSIAYKSYQFSIHILLVLFFLIKGIIKISKWLKVRIEAYRQATLARERQRYEQLQLFLENNRPQIRVQNL